MSQGPPEVGKDPKGRKSSHDYLCIMMDVFSSNEIDIFPQSILVSGFVLVLNIFCSNVHAFFETEASDALDSIGMNSNSTGTILGSSFSATYSFFQTRLITST